jgi:hypothetical protein
VSTRPYVVQQGDYLTQLAHRMGFDADAVWALEENRELRERRPNREVLHPRDVLRVPNTPPPPGRSLRPHATNKYRARVPTVEVRLALRDAVAGPLASKAYRVFGLGPHPREGTTNAEGIATLAVPIHVRDVRLVLVETGRTYEVLVGDMDPHDEPSGVRKRLANLGYLSRSETVLEGDEEGPLHGALRAFQAAQGIPVTGEPDQLTRNALKNAHGS